MNKGLSMNKFGFSGCTCLHFALTQRSQSSGVYNARPAGAAGRVVFVWLFFIESHH